MKDIDRNINSILLQKAIAAETDVSVCKDFKIDGINYISIEEVTVSDELDDAPTDVYLNDLVAVYMTAS